MSENSVCRILPNFLGVGSFRCGTTWIYECLKEHPDVFVPPDRKEVHFFDWNYSKDIEWYRKWFEERASESAVGEFSPSYLFHQKAPMRIARHLPDVKLIASLRDPVDRAYSNYWNLRSTGAITCSFAEARRYHDWLVEPGLYYRHLKRYLDLFPRENLLVLIFDDLESEPASFIRGVYNFLDVDTKFVPTTVNEKSNPARKRRGLWLINIMAYSKILLRKVGLDVIVETVKKTGIRQFIYKQDPQLRAKYPEMSPETRKMWVDIFLEENQKLSDWLGRDLCDLGWC
jgi:hypothetical protein